MTGDVRKGDMRRYIKELKQLIKSKLVEKETGLNMLELNLLKYVVMV